MSNSHMYQIITTKILVRNVLRKKSISLLLFFFLFSFFLIFIIHIYTCVRILHTGTYDIYVYQPPYIIPGIHLCPPVDLLACPFCLFAHFACSAHFRFACFGRFVVFVCLHMSVFALFNACLPVCLNVFAWSICFILVCFLFRFVWLFVWSVSWFVLLSRFWSFICFCSSCYCSFFVVAGFVPPEFGNLASLVVLNLSWNFLSGERVGRFLFWKIHSSYR